MELLCLSQWDAAHLGRSRGSDSRAARLSGGIRLPHDMDEPRSPARVRHQPNHGESHLRGKDRKESKDGRADGNCDWIRQHRSISGFGSGVAQAFAFALAWEEYNAIRDTLVM